ncbi:pyruvate, phosphate dikinase [Spirochaetia bacterium]|nr:pyruvate, phosphate dikinase [Spirochaetia bacterium]
MDKRIHFFCQGDGIPQNVEPERLGLRGQQANEFAALGFPILPGFIIDTTMASELAGLDIQKDIRTLLDKCGAILGKRYGDTENPLFLKIVVSSSLAVSNYPILHNFGLVTSVVPAFARRVGEEFAAHEVLFLARGMLRVEERIKELEGKIREQEVIAGRIRILEQEINAEHPGKRAGEYMDRYAAYFPGDFFISAEGQLLGALTEVSRLLALDDPDRRSADTAILVQPMVYGNYGKDSAFGDFFSRNVVTGDKTLQGTFYRGNFNGAGPAGQDIEKIGAPYLKELTTIARTLEDTFREIRRIRFTIESDPDRRSVGRRSIDQRSTGKLWLIEEQPVNQTSTQADIRLLLDLAKRQIVDNAYVVRAIEPFRLNEMLHPVIDPPSVTGLVKWSGGIAGSPGAAIGRVYFSAAGLMEARKLALQTGEAGLFILALTSSFAEDVKAIEAASGVLTAEGGYAAHASVVARQYGKVSLVAPALRFKGKKAILGDISFSEGEAITISVPRYGEPVVYLGQAKLIEPTLKESGLLDFIALAKSFTRDFRVRANAETSRDAALARSLGAEGIGLCRTEHMFFGADRINVFREMLLSGSPADREKALTKLQVMQRDDFYGIFKVMAGLPVTIRLLDSPLHEFLPRGEEELAAYLVHAAKTNKVKSSKVEVLARIQGLHEFNPMLGHRGCRIAVSYPEIYAMQVRAIFEAAYKLRAEKIEVHPEILVPIVMNAAELKLIAYGKKIEGSSYAGIAETEERLRAEKKAKAVPYEIGAMIELPAAALGAGEIARYGQFFSFGTNDLTQTTLGISRDDFTAFMPDYTRYDLISADPFRVLDKRIKELIVLAVDRGRLTRPDLVCGLCGEHGANPGDVRFCMDAGLNYVSCSPYSAPVAILAVAQAELEKAEGVD